MLPFWRGSIGCAGEGSGADRGRSGRQFSYEMIAAVVAMPRERLDDALEQLVGAGLMHRSGSPPEVQYSFKHPLVQDAAYSTLLRGRRQQMLRDRSYT